jgi:hypothetical protein
VPADQPEPVERPADDDYDLLTYGEVAARLAEVLAAEQSALDTLRAAAPPDPVAIAAQQARIAELTAGRARYEEQATTSETFMKRFGLAPRPRKDA